MLKENILKVNFSYWDFDSLSRPVPSRPGQSRENNGTEGKKKSTKIEKKLKFFLFLIFGLFWIFFVPGRPVTEEFVPGFLLLLLSRDKGTTGRPVPDCPGTSRGNPSGDPLEDVFEIQNFPHFNFQLSKYKT